MRIMLVPERIGGQYVIHAGSTAEEMRVLFQDRRMVCVEEAAPVSVRHAAQGLRRAFRRLRAFPDEPFVIHPGEFCLARTLEWVELPDDVVARIEGKALWVDTMVPTPDGWRTMGGTSGIERSGYSNIG